MDTNLGYGTNWKKESNSSANEENSKKITMSAEDSKFYDIKQYIPFLELLKKYLSFKEPNNPILNKVNSILKSFTASKRGPLMTLPTMLYLEKTILALQQKMGAKLNLFQKNLQSSNQNKTDIKQNSINASSPTQGDLKLSKAISNLDTKLLLQVKSLESPKLSTPPSLKSPSMEPKATVQNRSLGSTGSIYSSSDKLINLSQDHCHKVQKKSIIDRDSSMKSKSSAPIKMNLFDDTKSLKNSLSTNEDKIEKCDINFKFSNVSLENKPEIVNKCDNETEQVKLPAGSFSSKSSNNFNTSLTTTISSIKTSSGLKSSSSSKMAEYILEKLSTACNISKENQSSFLKSSNSDRSRTHSLTKTDSNKTHDLKRTDSKSDKNSSKSNNNENQDKNSNKLHTNENKDKNSCKTHSSENQDKISSKVHSNENQGKNSSKAHSNENQDKNSSKSYSNENQDKNSSKAHSNENQDKNSSKLYSNENQDKNSSKSYSNENPNKSKLNISSNNKQQQKSFESILLGIDRKQMKKFDNERRNSTEKIEKEISKPNKDDQKKERDVKRLQSKEIEKKSCTSSPKTIDSDARSVKKSSSSEVDKKDSKSISSKVNDNKHKKSHSSERANTDSRRYSSKSGSKEERDVKQSNISEQTKNNAASSKTIEKDKKTHSSEEIDSSKTSRSSSRSIDEKSFIQNSSKSSKDPRKPKDSDLLNIPQVETKSKPIIKNRDPRLKNIDDAHDSRNSEKIMGTSNANPVPSTFVKQIKANFLDEDPLDSFATEELEKELEKDIISKGTQQTKNIFDVKNTDVLEEAEENEVSEEVLHEVILKYPHVKNVHQAIEKLKGKSSSLITSQKEYESPMSPPLDETGFFSNAKVEIIMDEKDKPVLSDDRLIPMSPSRMSALKTSYTPLSVNSSPAGGGTSTRAMSHSKLDEDYDLEFAESAYHKTLKPSSTSTNVYSNTFIRRDQSQATDSAGDNEQNYDKNTIRDNRSYWSSSDKAQTAGWWCSGNRVPENNNKWNTDDPRRPEVKKWIAEIPPGKEKLVSDFFSNWSRESSSSCSRSDLVSKNDLDGSCNFQPLDNNSLQQQNRLDGSRQSIEGLDGRDPRKNIYSSHERPYLLETPITSIHADRLYRNDISPAEHHVVQGRTDWSPQQYAIKSPVYSGTSSHINRPAMFSQINRPRMLPQVNRAGMLSQVNRPVMSQQVNRSAMSPRVNRPMWTPRSGSSPYVNNRFQWTPRNESPRTDWTNNVEQWMGDNRNVYAPTMSVRNSFCAPETYGQYKARKAEEEKQMKKIEETLAEARSMRDPRLKAKDLDSFMSPLDNPYANLPTPKTGLGYGPQPKRILKSGSTETNFSVPKTVVNDSEKYPPTSNLSVTENNSQNQKDISDQISSTEKETEISTKISTDEECEKLLVIDEVYSENESEEHLTTNKSNFEKIKSTGTDKNSKLDENRLKENDSTNDNEKCVTENFVSYSQENGKSQELEILKSVNKDVATTETRMKTPPNQHIVLEKTISESAESETVLYEPAAHSIVTQSTSDSVENTLSQPDSTTHGFAISSATEDSTNKLIIPDNEDENSVVKSPTKDLLALLTSDKTILKQLKNLLSKKKKKTRLSSSSSSSSSTSSSSSSSSTSLSESDAENQSKRKKRKKKKRKKKNKKSKHGKKDQTGTTVIESKITDLPKPLELIELQDFQILENTDFNEQDDESFSLNDVVSQSSLFIEDKDEKKTENEHIENYMHLYDLLAEQRKMKDFESNKPLEKENRNIEQVELQSSHSLQPNKNMEATEKQNVLKLNDLPTEEAKQTDLKNEKTIEDARQNIKDIQKDSENEMTIETAKQRIAKAQKYLENEKTAEVEKKSIEDMQKDSENEKTIGDIKQRIEEIQKDSENKKTIEAAIQRIEDMQKDSENEKTIGDIKQRIEEIQKDSENKKTIEAAIQRIEDIEKDSENEKTMKDTEQRIEEAQKDSKNEKTTEAVKQRIENIQKDSENEKTIENTKQRIEEVQNDSNEKTIEDTKQRIKEVQKDSENEKTIEVAEQRIKDVRKDSENKKTIETAKQKIENIQKDSENKKTIEDTKQRIEEVQKDSENEKMIEVAKQKIEDVRKDSENEKTMKTAKRIEDVHKYSENSKTIESTEYIIEKVQKNLANTEKIEAVKQRIEDIQKDSKNEKTIEDTKQRIEEVGKDSENEKTKEDAEQRKVDISESLNINNEIETEQIEKIQLPEETEKKVSQNEKNPIRIEKNSNEEKINKWNKNSNTSATVKSSIVQHDLAIDEKEALEKDSIIEAGKNVRHSEIDEKSLNETDKMCKSKQYENELHEQRIEENKSFALDRNEIAEVQQSTEESSKINQKVIYSERNVSSEVGADQVEVNLSEQISTNNESTENDVEPFHIRTEEKQESEKIEQIRKKTSKKCVQSELDRLHHDLMENFKDVINISSVRACRKKNLETSQATRQTEHKVFEENKSKKCNSNEKNKKELSVDAVNKKSTQTKTYDDITDTDSSTVVEIVTSSLQKKKRVRKKKSICNRKKKKTKTEHKTSETTEIEKVSRNIKTSTDNPNFGISSEPATKKNKNSSLRTHKEYSSNKARNIANEESASLQKTMSNILRRSVRCRGASSITLENKQSDDLEKNDSADSESFTDESENELLPVDNSPWKSYLVKKPGPKSKTLNLYSNGLLIQLPSIVINRDETMNLLEEFNKKKGAAPNLSDIYSESVYNDINYYFVGSETSCKLCSKMNFISQNNLTLHYKNSHSECEVVPSSRLSKSISSLIQVNSVQNELNHLEDVDVLYINVTLERYQRKYIKQSKMYACHFCNLKSSSTIEEFMQHVAGHTGEYRYKCSANDCKFTCNKRKTIGTHNRVKHFNEASPIMVYTHLDNARDLLGYMCNLCNFIQLLKVNMIRHFELGHKNVTNMNEQMTRIDLSKHYDDTAVAFNDICVPLNDSDSNISSDFQDDENTFVRSSLLNEIMKDIMSNPSSDQVLNMNLLDEDILDKVYPNKPQTSDLKTKNIKKSDFSNVKLKSCEKPNASSPPLTTAAPLIDFCRKPNRIDIAQNKQYINAQPSIQEIVASIEDFEKMNNNLTSDLTSDTSLGEQMENTEKIPLPVKTSACVPQTEVSQNDLIPTTSESRSETLNALLEKFSDKLFENYQESSGSCKTDLNKPQKETFNSKEEENTEVVSKTLTNSSKGKTSEVNNEAMKNLSENVSSFGASVKHQSSTVKARTKVIHNVIAPNSMFPFQRNENSSAPIEILEVKKEPGQKLEPTPPEVRKKGWMEQMDTFFEEESLYRPNVKLGEVMSNLLQTKLSNKQTTPTKKSFDPKDRATGIQQNMPVSIPEPSPHDHDYSTSLLKSLAAASSLTSKQRKLPERNCKLTIQTNEDEELPDEIVSEFLPCDLNQSPNSDDGIIGLNPQELIEINQKKNRNSTALKLFNVLSLQTKTPSLPSEPSPSSHADSNYASTSDLNVVQWGEPGIFETSSGELENPQMSTQTSPSKTQYKVKIKAGLISVSLSKCHQYIKYNCDVPTCGFSTEKLNCFYNHVIEDHEDTPWNGWCSQCSKKELCDETLLMAVAHVHIDHLIDEFKIDNQISPPIHDFFTKKLLQSHSPDAKTSASNNMVAQSNRLRIRNDIFAENNVTTPADHEESDVLDSFSDFQPVISQVVSLQADQSCFDTESFSIVNPVDNMELPITVHYPNISDDTVEKSSGPKRLPILDLSSYVFNKNQKLHIDAIFCFVVQNYKEKDIMLKMLNPYKIVDDYKCCLEDCCFSTSDARSFVDHLKIEKNRKQNRHTVKDDKKLHRSWECCIYCGERCPTGPSDLVTHIKSNHGYCNYQCGYCFYRSYSSVNVQWHQEYVHTDHPINIFQCNTMDEAELYAFEPEARSSELLKTSLEKYIRPFICVECGSIPYVTYLIKDFSHHFKTKHSDVGLYTCGLCKNQSLSFASLLSHYKMIHRNALWHCSYCLYSCDTFDGVQIHLITSHVNLVPQCIVRWNDEKEGSTLTHSQDDLITIKLEGRELTNNELKKAPKRTTNADEEVIQESTKIQDSSAPPEHCTSAQETETQLYNLTTPSAKDSIDKELNCNKVGLMGKHLYRCGNSGCNFSASHSLEYKDHILICVHIENSTGNNALKCYHCPKCFMSVPRLLEHVESHGERKYKCGLCQISYSNSKHVQIHMKKVHATKCEFHFETYRKNQTEYHVMFPKGGNENVFLQPSSKVGFSLEDLDELVKLNPTPNVPLICSSCQYRANTTLNLIRHLREGKHITTKTDLTNVMPCLDSVDLMFNKMTNHALSSNLSNEDRLNLLKDTDFKIPKFVSINKRFVCTFCNPQYLSQDELIFKHHFSSLHSDESLYKCPHCPDEQQQRDPITIDKIGVHLKFHSGKLFKCTYCDFVHHAKHLVDRHLGETHPEEEPAWILVRDVNDFEDSDSQAPNSCLTRTNEESSSKSCDAPKVTRRWKCNLCKVRYTDLNLMKRHIRNHKFEYQFKCALCNFSEEDVKKFDKHFSSVHPGLSSKKFILALFVLLNPQSESLLTPSTSITPSEIYKLRSDKPIKSIRGIQLESVQKNKQNIAHLTVIEQQDAMYGAHGSPVGNMYVCPICSTFKTKTEMEFRKHLYKETKYNRWLCNHCSYKCQTHEEMLKHHSMFHEPDKIEKSFNELPENPLLKGWVERVCEGQRHQMSKSSKPLPPTKISSASDDSSDTVPELCPKRGRPLKSPSSSPVSKNIPLPAKGAKRKLEDTTEVIDIDDGDEDVDDDIDVESIINMIPLIQDQTPPTTPKSNQKKKKKISPPPWAYKSDSNQKPGSSSTSIRSITPLSSTSSVHSFQSEDYSWEESSLTATNTNDSGFLNTTNVQYQQDSTKRTFFENPGETSVIPKKKNKKNSIQEKNEAIKESLKKQIRCVDCNRYYRSVMGLKLHIRQTHLNSKFQEKNFCHYCDLELLTNEINAHFASTHPELPQKVSKADPFKKIILTEKFWISQYKLTKYGYLDDPEVQTLLELEKKSNEKKSPFGRKVLLPLSEHDVLSSEDENSDNVPNNSNFELNETFHDYTKPMTSKIAEEKYSRKKTDFSPEFYSALNRLRMTKPPHFFSKKKSNQTTSSKETLYSPKSSLTPQLLTLYGDQVYQISDDLYHLKRYIPALKKIELVNQKEDKKCFLDEHIFIQIAGHIQKNLSSPSKDTAEDDRMYSAHPVLTDSEFTSVFQRVNPSGALKSSYITSSNVQIISKQPLTELTNVDDEDTEPTNIIDIVDDEYTERTNLIHTFDDEDTVSLNILNEENALENMSTTGNESFGNSAVVKESVGNLTAGVNETVNNLEELVFSLGDIENVDIDENSSDINPLIIVEPDNESETSEMLNRDIFEEITQEVSVSEAIINQSSEKERTSYIGTESIASNSTNEIDVVVVDNIDIDLEIERRLNNDDAANESTPQSVIHDGDTNVENTIENITDSDLTEYHGTSKNNKNVREFGLKDNEIDNLECHESTTIVLSPEDFETEERASLLDHATDRRSSLEFDIFQDDDLEIERRINGEDANDEQFEIYDRTEDMNSRNNNDENERDPFGEIPFPVDQTNTLDSNNVRDCLDSFLDDTSNLSNTNDSVEVVEDKTNNQGEYTTTYIIDYKTGNLVDFRPDEYDIDKEASSTINDKPTKSVEPSPSGSKMFVDEIIESENESDSDAELDESQLSKYSSDQETTVFNTYIKFSPQMSSENKELTSHYQENHLLICNHCKFQITKANINHHYNQAHGGKPYSLTYSPFNHYSKNVNNIFSCTYCAFRCKSNAHMVFHWTKYHRTLIVFKNQKCKLYNTGVLLRYKPIVSGYDETPIFQCKTCNWTGTEDFLRVFNCHCNDRITVNQKSVWQCKLCPRRNMSNFIFMFNHLCNKHFVLSESIYFHCTLCSNMQVEANNYTFRSLLDHVLNKHFSMFRCKICDQLLFNDKKIQQHLKSNHQIKSAFSNWMGRHILRIDFVHYLYQFSLSNDHKLEKLCYKKTS